MRQYRICSPLDLYKVLESDHGLKNQSSAAEHLNLERQLEIQEKSKRAEKLEKRYKSLLEDLKNDDAGYASTQLHFFKARLDELNTLTYHQFLEDAITFDQNTDLKYFSREAHEIIKSRLQERILWLARGIDQTIEKRKQNGTYKGEFTAAVILANAFNDIFYHQFGEFDIKEGENK